MTLGDVLQVRTSIKGRPLDTLNFSEREVSIGRDPACGVVFDNPGVSRLHAVISLTTDGRVQISDQRSSNGTYINGKRVEQAALLNPGDQVDVGKFSLHVSALSAAAVVAPVQQPVTPPGPFATSSPASPEIPTDGTVVLGVEQRQRILGESQSPPPRAAAPHRSSPANGAGGVALAAAFVAGVLVGLLAAMLLLR